MNRLIPLRIPGGWTVISNAFAEDARGEDLLLLRAGPLHLDLGWTSQSTYRLELVEGDTVHLRVENPSAAYMRDAIDLILGELARDADPASVQRLLAV
jgi:hypothetical protein